MKEFIELLNRETCHWLKFIRMDESKNTIVFEIQFLAKPGSKKEYLKIKDGTLICSIQEKPVDGEANSGFITYFANELDVAKSNVEIVRGTKGKNKAIQIAMSETKSRSWNQRIEYFKRFLLLLAEEKA